MAKGKKTGGRNFKRGNRAAVGHGPNKVPRSLKGNLKAVLEDIVQTEEPLIHKQLVSMLKSKGKFFQVTQFLAHYTVDKTLKVQHDLSKLSDEQLAQLESLVAATTAR